MSGEQLQPVRPDGTWGLLEVLRTSPKTLVQCSLGEASPAVAVFYTPRGCVARPDDRVQALCLQHIATDGVSEGTRLLLDLTLDEALTNHFGIAAPLKLGFSALELMEVRATLEVV